MLNHVYKNRHGVAFSKNISNSVPYLVDVIVLGK